MRIVALSDQHGYLPETAAGDLLIIAGDVCPDGVGSNTAMQDPEGQKAWFDHQIRPWLAAVPVTHKVLTWGNHDWCGQMCDFAADAPAVASTTSLQILVDESTRVPAGDGSRRRGELVVWGTPWSNEFMTWAFMKTPHDLEAVYAAVPDGVDIVVSHQPPYGYGDRLHLSGGGLSDHLGSRELLAAIERVKPKLVICGHIHDGYGRYEHRGVPIYNVSVVDENYRLVRSATVIDLPQP